MVIESLNINKSFSLRGRPGDEKSWHKFDSYFRKALQSLQNSGAEFAIIASNTPHNRFDAITAGIDIPVINIFEVVAHECVRLDARKALILGTLPTMESSVFPSVLTKHGITPVLPNSDQHKSMYCASFCRIIVKKATNQNTSISHRERRAKRMGRSKKCCG